MYKILEKCPLFRGMSSDDISNLFCKEEYTHKTYSKGEVIARKDSEYSSLMIVLEGAVIGTYSSSNGNTTATDEITTSDLISPAFLFGGYNRLPVDVIASSDKVDILVIHRAKLFELMQDSVIILSNFIDVLSNRANYLNKKLFYLSFASLKSKIGEYIIDGYNNGGVTTRDIMKYFDITLISVERILGSLVKSEIIDIDGENIVVKDVNKLKSI